MARESDILKHLPPVIKEYKEYKAIANAINPELNLLWQVIEDTLNDQFIESSTENGVKRREKILKITAKGTDTLDERRFRLLARENEKLPYTYRVLLNKLKTLCGEDNANLERLSSIFTLNVLLSVGVKGQLEEIAKLVDEFVPENMIINIVNKLNFSKPSNLHVGAVLTNHTLYNLTCDFNEEYNLDGNLNIPNAIIQSKEYKLSEED